MGNQRKADIARGGIALAFCDGTYTNWNTVDQNGQPINDGFVGAGIWFMRNADLSGNAGKRLKSISFMTEGTTPPGSWTMYYNDVALVSADGTVRPIYHRQPTFTFTVYRDPGVTSASYTNDHFQGAGPLPYLSTTYYHGDHLGSSRLMTGYYGWPVWSGTFLPFGAEVNAQSTTYAHKFTGMENDSETGLNHTWFRQQSPMQGRWLSPDPAGLAAVDLSNPQSLNRYAYALNNPLKYIDPYGLNICVWRDDENGDTYDDHPDSREECESNGGEYWVTDTTVNVSAGSDGAVTVIIFGGPAGFIVDRPGDDGGGIISGATSMLKTATRFYCRVSQPADVRTAGVGGDLGFLGTVGGQIGVAANGKSGELGVTFTLNNDVGVQSFDAYFYGGTVPNAPTNAALGGGFRNALNFTNHLNAGISKFGVTRGEDGSKTFTAGLSVLPFTLSGGTSRTGVLFNIPKLGYVLNWKAAVCSAVGG